MTKQWLTRRAVRSPVSRLTTAPISASALPSRTSSTAFSADAWLCGVSTIGKPAMSILCSRATASIRARGPTRIGAIRPIFAASTAPRSELSSHGCATAVGVGGSDLQTSSSRWYFSCLRSMHLSVAAQCSPAPATCRRRFASCFADRCAPRTSYRFDVERLADVLDHRELLRRRFEVPHALVAEQHANHCHQPLAIAVPGEQLGQRCDRFLGLIADDDVLLAPDAPPLVGLDVGQQVAVLGGELVLQRKPRQRQRRPPPREQRADAGQRLRKAALLDRGQRLLHERQFARLRCAYHRALFRLVLVGQVQSEHV